MSNERYQHAKRITIWSAVLNALLGCAKVFFGLVGHSHALFADGVHSFSDLLTDGLVLCAARFGAQAADEDHPYGHGRIETLATSVMAVILIAAGLGILWDAATHIQTHTHILPEKYVFFIALMSVLVNEGLYLYMKAVADRIQSDLIRANAWHHRSDALSSLVVLLGLIGTYAGYEYFDALAAAVVALLVIKMGAEIAWTSMRELIDTGVDEAMQQQLLRQIAGVPGVQSVHQLRTRSSNGQILVDVHVIVAPKLSVSEGHHIGQSVHQMLCDTVDNISDVIVHVDPEDDEIAAPSLNLPHREHVVQILQQRWKAHGIVNEIKDFTLHYLDGSIHIEIVLPVNALSRDEHPAIKATLISSVADVSYIKTILFYYTE